MLETVSLDKALNEKDVVSDAPYILAKTSNGDTVKISKADLASVVAGLTNTNFGFKTLKELATGVMTSLGTGTVTLENVDEFRTPGFYGHGSAIYSGGQWGILVVLKNDAYGYLTQIDICAQGVIAFRFANSLTANWLDWYSFTTSKITKTI